jgi:hypothetical protein
MEYILIIGGIVLAYIVTYYFWKKLPKDPFDPFEPVAPYKVEPPVETPVEPPVEPPVETVVVPVVESVVEVKSVVPELKVVTGSRSKTKRTKTPVKSAPAKKPSKPRIKKPTDNA